MRFSLVFTFVDVTGVPGSSGSIFGYNDIIKIRTSQIAIDSLEGLSAAIDKDANQFRKELNGGSFRYRLISISHTKL
jgi:hypothetical protein